MYRMRCFVLSSLILFIVLTLRLSPFSPSRSNWPCVTIKQAAFIRYSNQTHTSQSDSESFSM